MKMVDMKMSKKEMEDTMTVAVDSSESKGPQYPYELRICIEDDNIKALGLDGMSVGDRVTLVCEGEITEMSEREDDMGKRSSCRIQIQKVGNEAEDDTPSFGSSR